MFNPEIDAAVSSLLVTAIGLDAEFLQMMTLEKIVTLQRRIEERQQYENAVNDFLTIVLTTPRLSNHCKVRMLMARTAQCMPDSQRFAAAHEDEIEFERRIVGLTDVARATLRFIRQTRRKRAIAGEGYNFRLPEGHRYPPEYAPEFQDAFEELVKLAETKVTPNGIL